MNVYDFDDTIYSGDSTVDFYKFCMKKKPYIIFSFPFFTGVLFMLGLCKKVIFKEKFYRFLNFFDSTDELLNEFWDTHISNIKGWYLNRQMDNDVIISASPEFLLEPACERLNINCLMASVVDKHTGKYSGENCHGEEKVQRYRNKYGKSVINEFYSDSLSDTPMALISEKAYVITGEKTTEWNSYKLPHKKQLLKTFFSSQFLLFIVIGIINTVNCIWISALCEKFLMPNTAFVLGYTISLIIGYILNSKLNFHKSLSVVRLIKFAVSYVPNFVIQNAIVFVIYNVMRLPGITAYCAAGIIGIPITFLCVKLFAFASKK